ncbi:MAG: hypothetical protein U9R68_06015 [Planctomycetota bacterium]|nr:hypothetical protein [Planctomycetota bacterium]
MNARMTFAVGALVVAIVLAAAPRADAGGIVYWGGTRVLSTGTPILATPSTAAHVAGKAYVAGYQDGFRDGVRTETTRTIVTRTYVASTYAVPTYTVRRYTVPTVLFRPRPIVRMPRVRVLGQQPHWGHGHRPHRLHGSGLVIRW